MKFSYLTGEVGNIGISKVKKKVFDNSWWLAGGIDPSTVAAVWQPIRAASLASSYLRIAGSAGNVNLDPTIVGGVAPDWDAAIGWTFATNKYLVTGIIPANNQTWSAIVRFSDAAVNNGCLFGLEENGDFVIQPARQFDPPFGVNYWNGGRLKIAPTLVSGVLGFAGNAAYRNGLPEVGTIPATGSAFTRDVYIGGLNFGAAVLFYTGSIQAIAFYNAVLSAPQMAALSAAMMAL